MSALGPGTEIGSYRVERVVGSGGAGTVYLARNSSRTVAIKVLRPGPEGESGRARLEREARVASEIDHPGVVPVESLGHLPDGRPYLVMPFLEGRSLRDEITARGPLPAAEAWRIVRAVADAVRAAHAANVVHRDLKPDNVFLETRAAAPGAAAFVRVLDFGLAKIDPGAHAENEADLVRALTRSEVTVGTPAYMAPEQWWNIGAGPRTDQYALGVVLFETLTGKPPFAGGSIAELVQAHLHGEVPKIGEPKTDALLARALAKSEGDRFPDLTAFITEGDALFGGPPEVTAATTREVQPIVVHVASVAAVLVLAVLVGYAGVARHDPRAWIVLGGAPQFLTLLMFVVGCALLPRASRRVSVTAALSLALLPAVLGELGTFTDWAAVESSLPSFPDALAAVHEGMYEANLARFVGGALSVALLTSLGALLGSARASRDPASRVDLVLGLVLAFVVSPLAAALGAPSASWIALVAAAPLVLARLRAGARANSSARFVVETLALVLAVAVGLARIEAREAYLWATGATRAERAAEIVAAAAERRLTLLFLALTLALVALPFARRARAALRARTRPALVLLSAVTAGLALDVALRFRVARVVDDLRGELEPEFTLYAHLDPPPGDRLDVATHRPQALPAVQLARGAIAVNGKGVAPVAALRSTEGALVVGAEIQRALAASMTEVSPKTVGVPGVPSIALVVDRGARLADVRRVLELASSGGVTHVELLLTRGAPPVLRDGDPPEAAYVLQGDFVALPAEIDPGGAWPDPNATFESVVPTWVDAAVAGQTPRISSERAAR